MLYKTKLIKYLTINPANHSNKPTKIKFIRFVQFVLPLNHPQISTNFHKLTFVVGICWWIEKCFINLLCLHAHGD